MKKSLNQFQKLKMQKIDDYDAEGEAEEFADHGMEDEDQYNQMMYQQMKNQFQEQDDGVVRPLVISELHQTFQLDKKLATDDTIGCVNDRHIICQFCECIVIAEGNAVKINLDCNFIQNTLREYDICSTVWAVDKINKFQNVEVHQLDDELKYLCCLSCQSQILGFQIISNPTQIYIACDRVKLEL